MEASQTGRAFATFVTTPWHARATFGARRTAVILSFIVTVTGSTMVCAAPAATRPPTTLAVLGDSDSQGFEDDLSFPIGSPLRGGAWRKSTLQWTEVLGRLRASDLDLGARGVWGRPRWQALPARLVGLTLRAPRKRDHQYNFAVSGAGCADLLGGRWSEARSLARLVDTEPARWRDAVVVIRIGITVLGSDDTLGALASGTRQTEMRERVAGCADAVAGTVALLRQHAPTLRFVLVGVLNDADTMANRERWRSGVEQQRITAGLDGFDAVLRGLSAADPRIAFFDDRAWFAKRWGSRDAQGLPAYRVWRMADGFEVRHVDCDEPGCSVLADGHAGMMWNVLWAQALVDLLNDRFALGIPRIDDAEAARFAASLRAAR